MKVFHCKFSGGVAIISAYNRGHAVKLLSKELKEEYQIILTKQDPLSEVPMEDRKGHLIIYRNLE
jgi:hypothetical protein